MGKSGAKARRGHGRNASGSQSRADDTAQTPVQGSQPASPNLARGQENGASHPSQGDPLSNGDALQEADAKNTTGPDSPSQLDQSSLQNQEVTPSGDIADASTARPLSNNHSTSADQTSKSGDASAASGSAQETDTKAAVVDPSSPTTEQDTQPKSPPPIKKKPARLSISKIVSSPASNEPQDDNSLTTPKPGSSRLSSGAGPNRTSSIIDPKKPLPGLPTSSTSLHPPPPASSYAGSTYETPLSTAANTRSSTPTQQQLLMMHDTVKQTTSIDWYIQVPLRSNGLPQSYEATTSLTSGDSANGTVTWKTDVSIPDDPISTITIDSPARLDLRLYSTVTTSSPIIDRYVDGYKDDIPTITISWQDLKGLVGGNNSLDLLVSITITDAKEPLPSDPVITETSSPASIEALGGFLDQPGGHDVVFHFPNRSTLLFADRYILQRSSAYFRSRLQLPGEEAPPSTNGVSTSRKKLEMDSDDEFEGEDEGARAGTDSGSPNGIGVGPQSPTGKNGRDRFPIRSNTGISTVDTTHSKIEFHRTPAFKFEHAPQYPRNNIGVSVAQTSEISYRTFRAVLYYMYTGYIAFAPITANIALPGDTNLGAKELQEKKRAARESMVKTYRRRYPNRPEPVSPKSVYVAARKYGLPALQAHALARIQVDMPPAVTVAELFSPFTRAHQNIRDYHLDKAVSSWAQILKTPEWANVRKVAKEKPDSYFTEILFDILDRFAQSA